MTKALKPKVWINEKNSVAFRNDVRPDEIEELTEIVRQAYNAGLESGYRQGCAKRLV